MSDKKTHRLVNDPKISARYLADYMAASDIKKRSIISACKYQPIARVIQHNEAKQTISKFLRSENPNVEQLIVTADKIRGRMADSNFDRDLLDHNADYIERFANMVDELSLPSAEILPPGKPQPLTLEGVHITIDAQIRLRRLTQKNEVKIGMGTLRYAKGKALKPEVGAWQSSLLMGYLSLVDVEYDAKPERKLCLTIDAYTGKCFSAPTDSTTKFKNIEAACAAIAERWDNIKPPKNAVF